MEIYQGPARAASVSPYGTRVCRWNRATRPFVVTRFPVPASVLETEDGSMKTPLGRFRIAEKIGQGAPAGTIFQSRIPLNPEDPLPLTEDWITSRILWLEGLDEQNANTKDRLIYIHGTRHEEKIGFPDSHGCIRMRNQDVIELFDLVEEGTLVAIEE